MPASVVGQLLALWGPGGLCRGREDGQSWGLLAASLGRCSHHLCGPSLGPRGQSRSEGRGWGWGLSYVVLGRETRLAPLAWGGPGALGRGAHRSSYQLGP